MKTFFVNGEIVADEAAKFGVDDVAPTDVRAFLDGLDDGEDAVICINSLGGHVLAAMQIVSTIKSAVEAGHSVVARIESIAASSASLIACACSSIEMRPGTYMMIHCPWAGAEGNADDLRREASVLEQIGRGMVAVYRTKFARTADEIYQMMRAETWIGADEAESMGLRAVIIGDAADMIAARARISGRSYSHLPKVLSMTEEERNPAEEQEQTEQTQEEQPVQEQPVQEQPAEDPVQESPAEEQPAEEHEADEDELRAELERLRARVAELEAEREQPVEARVSGMQSRMQSRINALVAEHETQIQARAAELDVVNARLSAAVADLEAARTERDNCLTRASDLENRLRTAENALSQLHGNALKINGTPVQAPTTTAEARAQLARLPLAERDRFYKQYQSLING